MSEPAEALSPEWREAAADTVRALALARNLAAKHATEDIPESVLLSPLQLSLTIAHVGAAICNQIADIVDALERSHEPMLIARFAGIENELHRLANVASDAQMAGAFSSSGGSGDGRK